jgi:periplasmic copper chaperone A
VWQVVWIRATPPKAPSAAGYFTISNAGKEADRLVAASSTLAGKAELHQMAMKGAS